MKKRKKNLLKITIKKGVNEVVFYIKVSKEIEEFFKTERVRRSEVWKEIKENNEREGLEFYENVGGIELHSYEDYWYSDFGNAYLITSDQGINVAILRIKGLSKGKRVVLENVRISNEELKEWSRKLCRFVEALYKEYLVKVEIKNEVNLIKC